MQFADHLAQTMFSFRLCKGWAVQKESRDLAVLGKRNQPDGFPVLEAHIVDVCALLLAFIIDRLQGSERPQCGIHAVHLLPDGDLKPQAELSPRLESCVGTR